MLKSTEKVQCNNKIGWEKCKAFGSGVNHATELLHGLTLLSQAQKHPQKMGASVAESMKISRGAIKKHRFLL